MPVTYRFSCQNVSTRELEELFAATELGGRVGKKIRRAFLNSSLVCLAYDRARLIGASRAITDGEYHALIYDVAVLPEYQRHGIGRRMMQELLDRLPVWRVMLVADEDVQGFYRGLGFENYPDVMAKLDWERLYVAPAEK
jgi:ribosomal protein S18 acetylase RimI-like enzyme